MAIRPHGGGELVDLRVPAADREALRDHAAGLRRVRLSPRELTDLELLAIGGFTPLRGFMSEAECKGVVDDMHLAGDIPWTVPISLNVSREFADTLRDGEELALTDAADRVLAVMEVHDHFTPDRRDEARKVYRTDEEAHPGVAALYAESEVRLGGPVRVIELPPGEFPARRLEPAQTRAEFDARGWRTVAAFQTRNPIHRAHEYITKCALELTDGLLLHPLVGATKADDVPADVRMRCYEVLIENYYPAERVVLAVLPASMRYAGPREAIFHGIMRRNYGCTHHIIGRDHAGVGDYYGTYDAQRIFDEFDPEALGIQPLKFEHSFYCKKSKGMASSKTSNSSDQDRIFLSGTRVRQMLRAGEDLPEEFTRPEVSRILMQWAREQADSGGEP